MLPTQQLSAVLVRFEELRQTGHSITAEELCRDCPELVDEVRQRIAALGQIDNPPELSTIHAGDTVDSQKPGLTKWLPTIPGYVITQELARGGMGRVLAGKEIALDREVAIKTLLPGSDATRFVTEAKITARLPHPSIPPVYALGNLSDSSPYLAMKLVRGRTLAEELKSRPTNLHDLPRFLQIFEQIAHAVGFAHAQGIIHRDLKPANVMVGAFGEVQVMDWGLAKELRSDATQPNPVFDQQVSDPGQTVADAPETPAQGGDKTRSGAILGTPNYMAPEQARGEVASPLSDVFALGGILCSMLTGKAVFGGTTVIETLQQAAAGDTSEALGRLDACGAEPAVIALAKHCLAVIPAERPADGQAVAKLMAAYRQSVEERLKKAETAKAEAMVREAEQRKQRRLLLGSTATVVMVLLAGLGVSLWQMQRAMKAESMALAERDAKAEALVAESRAKQQAEKNLQQANTNLAYAKKSNELLGSVFIGLDPKTEYASVTDFRDTLKENLNKALQELEGSSVGDPLTVAQLQDTLGKSLLGLGVSNQAILVFEKAFATRKSQLGPDHPDTLISMGNLADGYAHAGQNSRALALYQETTRLMTARLGPDHSETLISMNNLAASYYDAGKLDKAIPLFEATLKSQTAKWGADNPRTLATINNLAGAYMDMGRWDKALPLYEQSLKIKKVNLGPNHLSTLTSMQNLALNYQLAGKLDLAIALNEETLERRKTKLGHGHPDTIRSMHNLAAGYEAAGKHSLALPLYEETLVLMKAKLGEDHPDTLATANNLAAVYQRTGRLDKASPLYQETLRQRTAKLGRDHPHTLVSMNNLANAYRVTGQLDQAIPLYEETLRLRKAKLGPDHPDTIFSIGNLCAAYAAAQQGEKAAPLLIEFVDAQRKRFPKEHPRFAGLLAQVAVDLLRCHEFLAAEKLLRESLAIREKLESDAWSTFNTQSLLGGALLGQKKYAEAEPLLLKGYEGMMQREKTIPKSGGAELRLPEALDRLIQLYTETNKPEEVKKWRAEKSKLPKAVEKKP